jgi:SAM-dependent methyltransferase
MAGKRKGSRKVAIDPHDPAFAGQAMYTPAMLRAYDAFVYGFNFPFVWRCPRSRLLALYAENVSARHLDIGVATGLLLDQCRFPVPNPDITLMDLNSSSLAAASRRLRRYAPHIHRANVLEPWGLPPGSADSVGLFNLLHCLPGSIPDKAVAFEHARAVLAPGGALFGVTILGSGVRHNWLARRELALANRRGVMSNLDDRLDDLRAALDRTFGTAEVTVTGSMALFRARLTS